VAKRLYILSSGAGGDEFITKRALEALKDSEAVVSYKKYIEDLYHLLVGKELYSSPMTKEIDRCKMAISLSQSGKTTSIISNGDVNVYGMASLIVELVDEMSLWNEIEVINIAGVTALLAVASRVGAPISQDFAVISLSDRLTSQELIKKRVKLSLSADFVVGIYNPKSRDRVEPYLQFLEELKRVENRLVVIASNIGRKNEEITITDSQNLIDMGLSNKNISMSTMILVGNSQTR